jgi:hypothetical protein
MLGDLIYEAKGKVTSIRASDVKDGKPKIEANIIQNGTLKGGIEATNTVTYWSILRPGEGGTYYAEGKGVFMAKDDPSGIATWSGYGIGHQLGQRRRDIGSVFCRTSSSSTNGNKLAFLNNIVGVFEYEADEMGNAEGKIWEWK